MVVSHSHIKLYLFLAFLLWDVNAALFKNDLKQTTSTKSLLLDLLKNRHQNLIIFLNADSFSSKYKDDDDVHVDLVDKSAEENDDGGIDDELESDENDKRGAKEWLNHLLGTSDDEASDHDDTKLYLRSALRQKCEKLDKCKKKCPKKKKSCEKVCDSLIDEDDLCKEKPKTCDTCGQKPKKKKCNKCKPKCDRCNNDFGNSLDD